MLLVLKMNRYIRIVLLVLVAVGTVQCSVFRKASETQVPEEASPRSYSGLSGFSDFCIQEDSVNSFVHRGATTVLHLDGARYEAGLTAYVVRDSLIYLSFVNSGFEIIRAIANPDSLWVIDRMSKVVYQTAFKRRFGHVLPADFQDLQALVYPTFRCNWPIGVRESGQGSLNLEREAPDVLKRINLASDGLSLQNFEFRHQRTGSYIMGEGSELGTRIFTNLFYGSMEAFITPGTTDHNRRINVRTQIPSRKYTTIEIR